MPNLDGYSVKEKRKPIQSEKMSREQYQSLIDLKKSRKKKDLISKSLYKSIGLCLSLSIVIFAFNWKTYQSGELVELGTIVDNLDEIIEIPISKQPPPPPPKAPEVFTIKEVNNEELLEEVEVNLDVELVEETVIEAVVYTPPEDIPEEEAEEVFNIVEIQPEPVGGISAFYKFVGEELKYPSAALRLGVAGTVFVQFIVEKDGSLTDFKVMRGIGAGCDEEAVRVLENAPNWVPGKQRGMPVRVYRIIPIKFVYREGS